jgi:glycosyltransferase involved in cell wall biosynthesis
VPSTSSHQPDDLLPSDVVVHLGEAGLSDTDLGEEELGGVQVGSIRPAGQAARSRRAAIARAGGRAAHGRHVLVVGPEETVERGGVAAHTGGLAAHLARSAASVSVLAASTRTSGAGRAGAPVSPPAGVPLGVGALAEAGIVRVRRQPTPGRGGWRRAGDELGFLTGALTATLPHLPDVVLGVTPGLGGAMAAARIARRHGAPLVLVVHDLVNARPDGTTGRGLTVAAAAERRLLRTAAEVAVTSPEIAEHLVDLGVGSEHVHLLPHWAPDVPAPADRLAARRALGWPLRAHTVVLASTDGARPDLATVQAAAEQLQGEARLVVLDDGGRRGPVPTQASGPGRVRRWTPADDVAYRHALAAADLLLLADRPDAGGLPMPGTLAHYLAAGRPVLAAVRETGSAAAELDRTAGAGLVVRPGDPRLLAAAIRALLGDEPLREAMGRASRRHAVERMDRSGTMRQLDALMREALAPTVVDLTAM